MKKLFYVAIGFAVASFLACSENGDEPDDDLSGPGVWITGAADGVTKYTFAGEEKGSVEGIDFASDMEAKEDNGTLWVADNGADAVVKISAAGAVLKRVALADPNRVTLNQKDGSCWVNTAVGDKIYRLAADGAVAVTIDGLSMADDVACYAGDGSCWTGDADGQLLKFRPNGDKELSVDFSGWNSNLPAVAVDPRTGDCWVSGYQHLAKVSPGGDVLTTVDTADEGWLMALAVDPRDGAVVAAADGKVIRYNGNGGKLWTYDTGSFLLVDFAINKDDGTIWVTDWDDTVLKLSPGGAKLLAITGVFGANGVAVTYR